MMKILVTGATGYIGSHTCVELLKAGYEVVALDNLSNSKITVLSRIEEVTGQSLRFHQIDLRNYPSLMEVLGDEKPDGVIHFAGLKAVGESVKNPLLYYENNVSGLLNLIHAMSQINCYSLVFSSSATVYDPENSIPYVEGMRLGANHPYGRTKVMCEQILSDLQLANSAWKVATLRYFNPVGAHESGLIGEDPLGIPNNLMPYLAQVAVGARQELSIYGGDWETPDGTGVRDYIHVVDLAKAHILSLKYISAQSSSLTINLGSGRGYSVLELLKAFEKVAGVNIPYRIVGRRSGDIAEFYADPSLAYKILGWKVESGLEKMCEDTWRWQVNNPSGY